MHQVPTSTGEEDKGSPLIFEEYDPDCDEVDAWNYFAPFEGPGGENEFKTPSHVDPGSDNEALPIVVSRKTLTWQRESSYFDTRKEAISYIKRLPNKYVHVYHFTKEYTVYGCSTHLACPSKIRIKKAYVGQPFYVQ